MFLVCMGSSIESMCITVSIYCDLGLQAGEVKVFPLPRTSMVKRHVKNGKCKGARKFNGPKQPSCIRGDFSELGSVW